MIYVIETENQGITSAFDSRPRVINKLRALKESHNVRPQKIDQLIYSIEHGSVIWEDVTIWEEMTDEGFVGVEDRMYIRSFHHDEDII